MTRLVMALIAFYLLCRDLHIGDVLVSISHCRAYATAYALAVRS